MNSPRDKASTAGVYTSLEELVSLSSVSQHLAYLKSKVIKQGQSGSHHSKFKGRGMEFAEVRPYQAGDDVRSIDWRVTARRQSPHTKLFQEERERPVMIACDQSASMFFGSRLCMKSVLAARGAALFAWSILSHNDRVGGIIFNDTAFSTVKPARSRKTALRFLKQLEQFNGQLNANSAVEAPPHIQKAALGTCMQELKQVTKPGSLVIIISDFHALNEASINHIKGVARHNEVVLIHCFDPLERAIPVGGELPIRHADTVAFIDGESAATRTALSNWQQDISNALTKLARNKNITVSDLDTSVEIEAQLQALTKNISGGSRR